MEEIVFGGRLRLVEGGQQATGLETFVPGAQCLSIRGLRRQVVDALGGFWHLDAPPTCIAAKPHRPAYGSDGDYFSKPNREDVFRAVYDQMHDADPQRFPRFY